MENENLNGATLNNTDNDTLITGTDNDDFIYNSGERVTIQALGGNDTVVAQGENVLVDGGEGENVLATYNDGTTLISGSGKDTLINDGGANVSLNAGDGSNNIANTGSNTTIVSGSGDDYIENYGANVSLDSGSGNDFIQMNGSNAELGNVIINASAGNDTIDIYRPNTSPESAYVSVDGGEGTDIILYDYYAENATLLGGAGNDYIFSYAPNALINGGDGSDYIRLYDNSQSNTIVASAGNDTIQNYSSDKIILADVLSAEIDSTNRFNVILNTNDGYITLLNASRTTINLVDSEGNASSTIVGGNYLNTGVDVMTKFFSVLEPYANDNYVDGVAVLDDAVSAVSFYSTLEDAVNAFTYAITDDSVYADTYERLYQVCGIVLGENEDYTVDTGAISGYNAGGSEVKDAQDIVPEPTGATISEQEMPTASATVAKSFYGNDGTYHTFTITAPENFYTIYDAKNSNAELDISDNENALALVEACAKALNAWWLEQAAKLAYDSYGLDIGGSNINYGFAINANYAGITSPIYESHSLFDTTPTNEIKIWVGLDAFEEMDLDNQNGDAITATGEGEDYLDRVIAHEMVHAVMYKLGTMKRNMPQFFTEGVADLVQGNDDFTGGYTKALSEFSTDYKRIYNALEFKAGTGTSDAYSGGYAFLRFLANQALDTDILIGTDAADVFEYYGGDAVISYFGDGDSLNYTADLSGVELSGGDYFITSSNGTLRLRDASDKNLSLGELASISGETFTVYNRNEGLRVGNEYLSLYNATATFDLANNDISNVTGTIAGFAGGEYKIYGTTATISAGDAIVGDGSGGVTLFSGDPQVSGNITYGGANTTIASYSGEEITASVLGASVDGNDVVIYTAGGNVKILDGLGSTLNVNGDEIVIGGFDFSTTDEDQGISGTNYDDTLTATDNGALLNGRDGDDWFNVNGTEFVQAYGGSGDDTVRISGGGATVDGGSGDDFISIGGDAKDTTVILSSGSDTLSGYDDSAQIFVKEIPSVESSGGNVIISGENGTLTVLDASEVNFVYDIFNSVSGAEITLGDGNNEVTNIGGSVEIVTGEGKDSIFSGGDNVTISAGDGDNIVYSEGDGASIVSGSGNDEIEIKGTNNFVAAGDGDNIIELDENSAGNTLSAGAGITRIVGYTGDNQILAQVNTMRKISNAAVLTTDDGALILLGAADETINVNGEEYTVSNFNTGVEIMHNFFDVLKYYSDEMFPDGTEILSEAIRAVSFYSDLDDAIYNFVYDVTQGEEDSATRLLNATGIILGEKGDYTADTGAVSGSHAGGSEVLDAQDIVPEPAGTKLSEIELPEPGSVKEYSVTGNDGTVITFNLKFPDSYTAVRDQANNFKLTELTDQTFEIGDETITAGEIAEMIPTLMRGMTLWFPAAVKLAYDSYGLNFDGKTLNCHADVTDFYSGVTDSGRDDLALDTLDIGINMLIFTETPLDADDPNGKYDGLYVDRILAHEMIHATMLSAGTLKFTMPQFFTEGVADLVQGDDDDNGREIDDITALTESYRKLYDAMNLNPGTGSQYAYPAGFMFLRYLINQNLNTEYVFGTDEADVYRYYGGDSIIRNFETGDSIDYHENIVSVELSNGDYLLTSSTGAVMLRGAGNQNIQLLDYGETLAEFDGDNFTISEEIDGNLRVGDINYVLKNFTGTFNLSDGSVSNVSGEFSTVSGSDGGEEISNSEVLGEVVGTYYGDTITNESTASFIDGRRGDDYIYSTGTNNTIHGGGGNDTLEINVVAPFASLSSYYGAYVEGGDGDDLISLSGENVTVETSAGDDTLTGADSTTTIIINNPVSVSENLIVTKTGTLNVEGSGYSVAYRILTTDSDTLVSGSSGNDIITAFGYGSSIDAGGGNDEIESYQSDIVLVNLFDSVTGMDFDFTDEALILTNGDATIKLDQYTAGELNFDGHSVYAVKSGNIVAYDSAVEYYNVAENATLNGLAAGDTVAMNDMTFAANADGTEIIRADTGAVVWSGDAENLASVNVREIYDTTKNGESNLDSDTLKTFVEAILKPDEETGYTQFAALFFSPEEENDVADPTLPTSSETLTTTSADGLQLSGVHFAPETSNGNWAILVTGYGRTKRSMYQFVDNYIEQGYDVLAIDPRAMGDSEGEWVTMGVAESHDLALWTQKVAEIDSSAKIVLHGVSMGAATAMLATADADATNVAAVVEDCGYTDVRTVFESIIAGSFLASTFSDTASIDALFDMAETLTGYDVLDAAPINSIANVTAPTLFINGDEDTVVPVSMAQALYEASGAENKQLLIVEGASHAASVVVDAELYETTLLDFLGGTDIEGFIAQGETLTIDGVVYTAADGDAQLNLDSDGKVTGITSGKVTAVLEGTTDPQITFDATGGSFDFNAIADTQLKVTYNGGNIRYAAGAVTYTAGGLSTQAGSVSVVANVGGSIPVTLALTFAGDTSVGFDSGTLIFNFTEGVGLTASAYGTELASATISGGLSFNLDSNELYVNQGGSIDVSSALLGNLNFSLTAVDDFSGTFAFDSSTFGVTYTTGEATGAAAVTFAQNGTQLFDGEINLQAGALTYMLGSGISLASGTVVDITPANGFTFTLTAAGTNPSVISFADGNVVLTADADTSLNIAVSRDGNKIFDGGINLASGSIVISNENVITMASGTTLVATLSSYEFSFTATDEASVTIAQTESGFTITPGTDDGAIRISVAKDGATLFSNEISISGGSIVVNSDNSFGLTGGTTASISFGDYSVSLTATDDASVALALVEEGIQITPSTGDGSVDITLSSSSGETSANIEVLGGSFIFGADGAISVTSGTELSIDFGAGYAVGFKATGDASGTISLSSEGITFTPNGEDGGLELSVTRDGETRTASLDVTGSVTYKLDGSISLAAGTVVKNVFEDSNALTITANTDANGSIIFSPQDGLTVTPATADALNLLLTSGDFEIFDITSINGSLNYRGGVLTLSDGTSIDFSIYDTWNAQLNTAGGDFSVQFNESDAVYTAEEGATVTLTYSDGAAYEFSNGSATIAYDVDAVISLSEGIDFKSSDNLTTFLLSTAGTYTLNGTEITTTSDGVEVWLTDNNTVTFDVSDNLTVNGQAIEGTGNVSYNSSNGSLSLAEGTSISAEYDGVTMTITANKAADGLITLTDEVFTITSTDSDTLTVALENDEDFDIMTISGIEGSLSYDSDSVMTLSDGTSIDFSIYDTWNAQLNTAGGDFSVQFNESDAVYTAEEGATVTLTYSDGAAYEYSNGSATIAYDVDAVISLSEGIDFKSSDNLTTFLLPTAGTYTLNGATLTTTSDGVEVWLTDLNTVEFEADSNVIFNGETLSGSIKIIDGELELAEIENETSNVAIALNDGATLTNAGDNVTVNGAGDNTLHRNTGDNVVVNFAGGNNYVSNIADSSGATLTTGDGTDTFGNGGSNALIQSGAGNDSIANNGDNVTINAGEGDNTVRSHSAAAPVIMTGDGNNKILNRNGNGATIQTGAGNDIIANENSDDVYINAGSGDNSVNSACENVTVISEGGNDTVYVDGANTSVTAGDGDNYIVSTGDNVTITSGAGDDTITNVNSNGVYIDAGDGDNNIASGLLYTVDTAADTLDNFYESETIITGSGNDTIDNFGGYYVSISTGEGDDSIKTYHSYYNTVDAGDGDDKILIQNGHYQNINAGAGNDTIIGKKPIGSGNWATGSSATLIGGEGDDYISTGYADLAQIDGGEGNDTIITDGPNATIDGGEGDDFIQIGASATSNVIVTVGDDTIKGYNETTTLQGGTVSEVELDGKDVIITTDEGTLTIINGKDKVISIDDGDEVQQVIAGVLTVADGETLSANGLIFTGSGKVTIAGDNVTLGSGVAVDGVEEVVLTKKGAVTVNGQSFQLTEKVPAGVTVATIEDGISVAHVVTADDVPEDDTVDVGKIFYEETYIYEDDSYGVRVDAGGLRSIYGLSSGVIVESKGSLETAVSSGEYAADYSVLQLGLSEAGVYTFGGEEYTIGAPTSDTPVGVNVRYDTDNSISVTRVRYLSGDTISGDFTGHEVTIGSDKVVSIAGDDNINIIDDNKKASVISGVSNGATIYSAGGATKFTTDEDGEFYLVNYTGQTQNFTVEGDNSVDFVLSHYTRPDGEAAFQVEGVYNFENGTIIYDSDTAYHAFNIADKASDISSSDVVHFGNGDPSSFANEHYYTVNVVDSQVVSIDGVSIIENLKGDVTVHGTGAMTVNKKSIEVDGDDDFNVIVSDGKVTKVTGIDDGATINGEKITYELAEEGTFVLGFTEDDSISVTLNANAPTDFVFGRDKFVSDINGLDGEFYFSEGTSLNVNGVTISISSAAKAYGNGEELVSISGFANNTSISTSDEVIIQLDNDSTVTLNKTTFALSGDKDSVAINGSNVTGLDAGASLKVSSAGTYTVNGYAFDAKADDTFIATAEGVYIYNPNSLPVTTDTATEDILTRFDVIAETETAKSGATDLSTETVTSALELTSGNQSVKFNDRGNNAAIVSETANGVKDITLGGGGDLVVVEDTGADVNITTGAGNDTIVNQGTSTYIDMAAGGADKVYALGGSATLDNYHASTGSGLQTEFSDIGTAIENGKIQFLSSEVSLNGAAVYVEDGYDDSTLVDFYDVNGNEQLVGFTNTEGGSIDLSTMNKTAIIIGGRQAASSIVGSANDDTIYAAAGDTINGYGGDNLVKLSTNRQTSADGAAIEIPTVRSATIVENFKTGFDVGDDYIRADIDVSEVRYVSGDIVIKHDDSKVVIKDVGDGSSANLRVDDETLVIVARGASAKVADEVADFYIGKKSALDFSDDYERDVYINLAANIGTVGAHDVKVFDFDTITAGGGKTTLIGSSENEEFYAGSNDNSIYGGGGRDMLHGYTGDDKNGSTEFFFMEDRATITGFEFTDGNGLNPDKINTGAQGVSGVGVNGDDVYVELFNGGRLMIDGAAGKNFAISNSYDDVVAQISSGDLTYDGHADYFSTTTKSRAKVEVSSEVDNAGVWLNNDERGNAQFYGNIYELDGSAVEGNATLVGNDFDNVITAGKGNSSLWGGSSASNDTLIGGDGRDLFWYEMGNGNDQIQGAGSNDSVNLYGITVDMLTTEVTADSVTLKFNNGQTLKLDTNDGTTFQLADGSNWTYDKSDSSWKTK